MRADRLVAALLVLQRRGLVTASQLAGELEISVATARRDLEALSAAGIPVYPQPGRNGGWQLLGGGRTDLTGLTADETRALFVLAGPATTAAPALKSALRKLVRALPEPLRDSADAAASAVVIDARRWGDRGRARPRALELLEVAVVERTAVELHYRDRQGNTSTRRIDPLGLADKGGVWYVIARTSAGLRTFRVDRVVEAQVTGEHFERPPDFDLQTAWAEAVDEVERHRGRVTATIRVPARLTGFFVGQWGRHAQIVDQDGDVNVVVVGDQSEYAIARQLAGWADAIEIVEPAEIRDELVRIGQALVRCHSDPASPEPALSSWLDIS